MRSFIASFLDKFGPHLALLVAILLTTCALCAEDVNATAAPPKSLPMPAAILVAKADQEIVKVRKTLVESLTKAQADATKKGDLDGALSIKAKIEQVSADLPAKAVPVIPPPQFNGAYSFSFPNGHAGRLNVSKSSAAADAFTGNVMATATGWTITWSNNAQWLVSAEDGVLYASCSDGRCALVGK